MKTEHIAEDIVIAVDSVESKDAASTAREREKDAVSRILKSMLGDVELHHNEAGKPLLDDYNISITHSLSRKEGYAAVMISKTHEVGIDIEYVSPRIMKIASRFLRNDETPDGVTDNLIHWCAKEAVYKLFSADDLTYQQMRVNAEMTEVENLKTGQKVPITCVVNDKYVMVYCYL